MSYGATPEEIVRLALEAISDRDAERLRPLLAPGVSVHTGRGSHEGDDAVLAWARKGYEHLDRRWRLESLEPAPGRGGEDGTLLGRGRVEYVWRESGEVGDTVPIFLLLRLDGQRLARLEVFDELEAALAALDAR